MEKRESLLTAFLHDPITPLWRALASARASWLLLALLGLALLLSLLIPQLPAEVRGDVLAYNRWLAEMRNEHGAAFDLWRAAGLLDIRASLGLRLLLAALAFCVALRSIDLTVRVRVWQRGDLAVPPAEQALACAWGPESADRLRPWLAARGFQARQDEQGGQTRLVAWRFPWHAALLLAVHVGALCFLAGLLLNYRAGWQETQLALSEGQTLPIGHNTSLSLEGQEISTKVGPDGRPEARFSQLGLWRDGAAIRQVRVGPSRPAYYRGILISHAAVGPAVALAARDATGRPLEVRALSQPAGQGEDVRFQSNGDERYLYVPEGSLTLRLTYYDILAQQSEKPPIIHVEAYRSGQAAPIYDAFLSPDSSWNIGSITYQMRSAPYALLSLSFVPGLWPMLLGLLCILGGAGASLAPLNDRGLVVVGRDEEALLYTFPSARWGRAATSEDPLRSEVAGWLGESR